MSSETSAWAKEKRCGDPVTKAVLREIANWAKPTGIVEFLSVKRLAEVVEVSTRTVQRHIARLEEDQEKGGLGMIRRVARHREDGGQGANSFELVGYKAPATAGDAPRRQSVTPPRHNDAPRRQTVGEPHDNRVTRLGDKIIPPSSSSDDDTPAADLLGGLEGDRPAPKRRAAGHRLPEDWAAPPVDQLPAMARDLVQQWPSGAYQASCETFRLHWLSETRAIGRKSDWGAALGKWLINDHPKVIRDAKAGVSFVRLAPARPTEAPRPPRPVAAKEGEDDTSAAIHAALAKAVGASVYDQWLAPCAIMFDAPGAVVVAGSEFVRNWAEQHFSAQIKQAARSVTGENIAWVRFEVQVAKRMGA